LSGGARLLLITDGSPAHLRALSLALGVLPRGGALVQVRAPGLAARDLLERAQHALGPCVRAGAPLLVNDRADVALAVGAAGVHLPGRGLSPADARSLLGPRALIGVSCHSPDEVGEASRGGADYAVFSPLFAVPGKGPPQGLPGLAAAVRAAPLPVFALGGIDAGNALSCVEAGARGVACIRAVLEAADPAAAAIALWQAVTA
jgi:thiamine-phosphate pyrophosphorylase